MLNKQQYTDYYEKHYQQGGKQASGTGEHVIKGQMWRDCGYVRGMSVLDYGCGWGAMLPEVYDPDLYVGVDISPTAIALAQEINPGVDFRVIDSGSLNLDRFFDFIVAASVFTHIPHPYAGEALGDINKHLHRDGFAIIDILDGQDNPNHPYIHHWPLVEFADLLQEFSLAHEFIKKINWGAFEHSYLKVWHDR